MSLFSFSTSSRCLHLARCLIFAASCAPHQSPFLPASRPLASKQTNSRVATTCRPFAVSHADPRRSLLLLGADPNPPGVPRHPQAIHESRDPHTTQGRIGVVCCVSFFFAEKDTRTHKRTLMKFFQLFRRICFSANDVCFL